MCTPSSLPCPDSVSIQRLSVGDTHIVIELTTCRGEVPCPDCAQLTHRLHSRYRRTVADLPLQDKAVSLVLHSRKFFCTNSACQTRVFTERIPDLVAPYARRTVGLQEALHLIGLALGGRAGAALARALKMYASRDTVLRSLRKWIAEASREPKDAPRVVGIDDWAFRKGQRYGTIICDLERHRVIDLLADRSSESAAKWFRNHPAIEIISRDRGGMYAQAAREGAPHALQIADRWHLLKNLG
jgi:transposase